MLDKNAAKERFKELYLRHIATRDLDGQLWAELERGGFFEDPASTKHHLACQGGLCVHSLHVYDRLKALCDAEHAKASSFCPSDEAIAICGLLHDVCKMGTYVLEKKNTKIYDADLVAAQPSLNVKHDSSGAFYWDAVPQYTFQENFAVGHGSKSVIILQQYIKLTPEEIIAIFHHMGSWGVPQGKELNALSAVYEANTLAFLLHVADEMATYIDERED